MQTTSATLLSDLKRADDLVAWSQFVRLYSPLVYGWAGTMGLQDADALDLVQDVFTTLVKKIPHFSYDSSKGFRNWLFIVTRNKYLDLVRARQHFPKSGRALPEQLSPSPVPGVEQADFQRFFFQQLLPSMKEHFQPSTWQAFWQHVVEEKPAPQVAEELGVTVNAVFKAKIRVMTRLKQEMADLIPALE